MSRILKSSYINIKKEETININNYTKFYDDETLEEDSHSLINQHQINRVNEEAREIIENAIKEANLEAEIIIKNALKEAEVKKEEVYQKSKEEGYNDGIENSKEDVLAKQNELDIKIKEMEDLREKTLISLEKEIVSFVIDLTKKVLTKSFELNPDIIRFLVQKGLTQVKNFENLKIYVSENQYDFVEANKNEILGIDTQNYQIQIIKDTTISDMECLIETDFGTINCSCIEQFEGVKNALAYMLDNS